MICGCDACQQRRDIMSKRTLRDYISQAFLARDKATVAQIMKDAEELEKTEHAEPDGDEGPGNTTIIHHHHGGDAATATGDAALTDRVGKLEKSMDSIGKKLDRVLDGLTGKDGELPPWLAKKGDDDKDDSGDDDKGDDDDKKENPFAKKDDDGDGDEKKTDDDLPTGRTEGAQVAEAPSGVEGELMEADPALKTGPSKMGDAAYRGRLAAGFKNFMQETRARAEILAPGMKVATIDAAQGPKAATIAVCNLRRNALAKALTDARTGPLVGGYITADSIKTMSCDAVRLAFLDASDRVRQHNNASGRPSEAVYASDGDPRAFRDQQIGIIRSINKRNQEFWAKHGGLGPQGSIH